MGDFSSLVVEHVWKEVESKAVEQLATTSRLLVLLLQSRGHRLHCHNATEASQHVRQCFLNLSTLRVPPVKPATHSNKYCSLQFVSQYITGRMVAR